KNPPSGKRHAPQGPGRMARPAAVSSQVGRLHRSQIPVSRFLFLTLRMTAGWGVAVAVHNLALRLVELGHLVRVGCLETDGSFHGYPILTVPADVGEVRRLAAAEGDPIVIAHTSPYFELLPNLARSLQCWAMEYGDPTPSFFVEDAPQRELIKRSKQLHCYPNIDG